MKIDNLVSIDTINCSYSEFKIKDWSKFYMKPKEILIGNIDYDPNDEFYLENQSVHSYKVYLHYVRGLYIQIVQYKGLQIKITPAKINGTSNFFPLTISELETALSHAKKEILKIVDLNFEDGIINRIDLFRNIETIYPISTYSLPFIWLNGNWQAVSQRYRDCATIFL